MGSTVNYSGLVVAGSGFFLTRFTVTLALYEDPMRFYFAGVVPLLLGLGLAAFGVALTVADVETEVVRTTAAWCVVGWMAMAILVILTLLGSRPSSGLDISSIRAQTYLSNFLIGGAVGGTLTGLYAARTRRQRLENRRQANRLDVLNRLLRHEVLNSVAAILGYSSQVGGDDTKARAVIEEQSRSIQQVVENVKQLARSDQHGGYTHARVDLGGAMRRSVDEVERRYPEATIDVDSIPESVTVRATSGLEQVFTHLLENAIIHGDDAAPVVQVTTTSTSVRVTITDDGPGLPDGQRTLLETGEIHAFDDPSTGFGLNLVRLFVDDFGGSIQTDVGPSGSTVTVELSRAVESDLYHRPLPAGVIGVRPALPHLLVTLLAAIVAGAAYGVASESLGGSIAGIGVFYGTASPVVGWLTHEFHSIVFGFVYAGLVSVAPRWVRANVGGYVVVGLGWAIVLWLVAAGVIAPIWLQLLGIPASIPNLTIPLLVSHLAWGLTLGVLTAIGFRWVATSAFSRETIERCMSGIR